MQSHLDKLNEEQKKAVTHTAGPLLIVAGAGAGKTRTITHRIVNLIKTGVAPENILAVTFTNKAAKEMRERVRALIENDTELNRPISALHSGLSLPFVSTFHALSVRILREFYNEVGIPKSFTIFDRSDSVRAIKRAMKRLGIDIKQHEPRSVLNAISRKKGEATTTNEYATRHFSNPYEALVARVWQEYETILKKEKSLDFDDLLLRAYTFLKGNTEARKLLQNRWKYIHIDEYQDTNTVQYELVRLLIGSEKNICVVADTDQCIYTWRQARPENVFEFEREFKSETVMLEQNYRSTQTILAAANDIITKNSNRHDKTLFTKNPEGEKISVYSAMDAGDEARAVVAETKKLIDEKKVAPKEIAILYRANFQSRVFEESLLYANLPYQVLGTRFFDRKEIKDVLSYIRAALNPSSLSDIARIISTPPRGIGKQTLSHMIEGTENKLTPAALKKVTDFKQLLEKIAIAVTTQKASQALRVAIKESGLEAKLKFGTEEERERYENMQELVTLATKYDAFADGEGMEKLLEDAALATDQDELEEKSNSIKLMTVHSAKGLEFDYVFIVGLEEGLFPHERLGGDDNVDEEEERRLFYVALTRARKKVYLSHTFMRTIYGKQQVNTPSEFLTDIDEVHLTTGENRVETNNLPHKRGVSLLDDIEF